ncbi:MAG: hypothetical protein IKC47_03690 [Clostridia bacterium]|nr:hypothetical protein [Clostridia bacterium]
MMSRQQVMTREETANMDVYADVNNVSAANTISTEDQQMLDAIQRKLGVYTQSSYVDVDESSDVKPSQSTLTMTYKRDYAKASHSTAAQSKLNTKSKVAIASYVAVVLVLVVAVALCAATINGSFEAVVQGQDAYNQVNGEIANLQDKVNTENYDELYQKALEMGFVEADANNSYQYTKLETRPAQNFVVETNWFDQVCNWLSGVFGG